MAKGTCVTGERPTDKALQHAVRRPPEYVRRYLDFLCSGSVLAAAAARHPVHWLISSAACKDAELPEYYGDRTSSRAILRGPSKT